MGLANTVVEVRNGNVAGAIKIWKQKTEGYKIKERLLEKKEFQKPSEKKRLQKEQAIRKNKLRNANKKINSL